MVPDPDQRKRLTKLQTEGFSCRPLPLGGYLITDLAGRPMLATPYPHTPVHYLAPGNFVELAPTTHNYTCEV
jgi:hypothetical protein